MQKITICPIGNEKYEMPECFDHVCCKCGEVHTMTIEVIDGKVFMSFEKNIEATRRRRGERQKSLKELIKEL